MRLFLWAEDFSAACEASLAAVNAHVVDPHLLWKLGGAVRIARPGPANGKVQQDEKWMVIDPAGVLRQIRGPASGIEVLVDVEADLARLPLHGEDVEAPA